MNRGCDMALPSESRRALNISGARTRAAVRRVRGSRAGCAIATDRPSAAVTDVARMPRVGGSRIHACTQVRRAHENWPAGRRGSERKPPERCNFSSASQCCVPGPQRAAGPGRPGRPIPFWARPAKRRERCRQRRRTVGLANLSDNAGDGPNYCSSSNNPNYSSHPRGVSATLYKERGCGRRLRA